MAIKAEGFRYQKLKDFIIACLPNRTDLLKSGKLFGLILLGAALLYPILIRAPLLGWDWYYFFNAGNPTYNLYSAASGYPPYAQYFIEALTWINWRSSLAILNGINLMTIAIAIWQQGGKYGSIVLGLTTPALWFLMWIGHPDGLALLGIVTGFIPLALIKPNITAWSFLSKRAGIFWMAVFLALTLLLWPLWPKSLLSATMTHEAAFGWVVTGWPVAILGFVLLIGAGEDPYRLMAAGCLMSPYLMPYHLVVLIPVLGKLRGVRKIVLWLSSFLLLLGVGLGGGYKYLNLVFPILAYALNHDIHTYYENVRGLPSTARELLRPA